ncbi:hypothetical protein AXF42_Ash021508 [Apostasia shenzhenica]|uniref:Uncharacterized protein n=1 Tax=Apostasia shenzhenica TaxID=1088818 RepID=A0A2H9ZZV4_9ASPA|nr:hypothetical protein AXF42_Ash021508 [Apostasia shenzhenica]
MKDTYLLLLPPQLAVRGDGDVGGVVKEAVGDGRWWPAGEDEVVGLHDLLSSVGRGDDNGGGGAELEKDDGAVSFREGVEGAVRELTDLEKVAQDGEPRRRRRQIGDVGSSPEENNEGDDEWEQGEESNQYWFHVCGRNLSWFRYDYLKESNFWINYLPAL